MIGQPEGEAATCEPESDHRLTVGPGYGASIDPAGGDEARLCAARHLAVAASEIVRESDRPEVETGRFAATEALLRAWAEAFAEIRPHRLPSLPFVHLARGRTMSVVDLMAEAIGQERWWIPLRSIDRELVHAAKEVLGAIRWRLPVE